MYIYLRFALEETVFHDCQKGQRFGIQVAMALHVAIEVNSRAIGFTFPLLSWCRGCLTAPLWANVSIADLATP
jgi:hypothetical protein